MSEPSDQGRGGGYSSSDQDRPGWRGAPGEPFPTPDLGRRSGPLPPGRMAGVDVTPAPGEARSSGFDADRVRVLVVDDEVLVQQGLMAILGADPGIEVVAATDGVGALTAILRHRLDVVLLDLHMPRVDGMQVLAAVRRLDTPPVVAVLTGFDADDTVAAALAAGAAGYLLKDTEPALLAQHVRSLALGRTVLSSGVTSRIVDSFLQGRPSIEDRSRLQLLSNRHREVLALIGRGCTNAEIAAALHVAIPTVKDHVTAIMSRLGLDNRVRVALFAVRSGLVGGPDDRG